MNPTLVIIIILFAIILIGTPIVYVLYLLKTLKKNRKEVQGNLLVSFFNRVTHEEEILLCMVIDKYKVIPPGGSKKKEASKSFPHGYYLHCGAVKDQPIVDEEGQQIIDNKTGQPATYSGSITSKAFWPIGKKPETQAQVEHAYYNIGDPRPLNPYNSFLPVNTDVAVQVLADENALQTLLTHVRYEFESIFKMLADVKMTAKYQKYIFWGLLGCGLLSLVSVIVGIMAMRQS